MIRLPACFFLALACACGGEGDARPFLTLASTTSTQNSGLYEFLMPKFTAATGIDVRVIAVGTGRAVQLARASRSAEELTSRDFPSIEPQPATVPR